MGNIFSPILSPSHSPPSHSPPPPKPKPKPKPSPSYPTDYNYVSIDVKSHQNKHFLDDYDVIEFLQNGTFGAVYKCRRKAEKGGGEFAVKFFGYLSGEPDPKFIDLEIGYMLKLKGEKGVIQLEDVYFDSVEGYLTGGPPKITSLINRGVSNSKNFGHGLGNLKATCYPCLVMEKLDGGDIMAAINDQINEGRYFTFLEVLTLFEEILLGLQSIHSKGLVHRDLKLDNILIKSKGSFSEIKIIDFGLMEEIQNLKKENDDNRRLIQGGRPPRVKGTKGYNPPELNGYGQYSIESDIYSLGCCLYTLLLCEYLPMDAVVPGGEERDMAKKNAATKRVLGYDDSSWERLLFDNKNFDLVPAESRALVKDLLLKMLARRQEDRIPLADIAKHDLFKQSNSEGAKTSLIYSRLIKRLYLCHKIRSVFVNTQGIPLSNKEDFANMAEYFFKTLKKSGDESVGITLPEFKSWIQSLSIDSKVAFSEHDIQEVFAFCDHDNGGDIDENEFLQFLTTILSHTTKAN